MSSLVSLVAGGGALVAPHSHVCGCGAHPRHAAQFSRHRPIFALSAATAADEDGEYTFWDRTELFVRSGAGGDGAVAFVGRRPAGGSGGAGGSVVLEATDDVNTLAHLQHTQSIHADRGDDASGRASGRDAADAVIRVPPNVEVWARPAD